MRKKVGIITIYNSNYGNRLQNYALQQTLKNHNCDVTTIKNITLLNIYNGKINYLLRNIKSLYKRNDFYDGHAREKYFKEFNKYITKTSSFFNWLFMDKFDCYDYLLFGSDQIWNPNTSRLTNYDLGTFSDKCKISYAASFGISNLPLNVHKKVRDELLKFKSISVREESGKEIVENLTNRNDIEVLVDPTMLLTANEWDKVSKKPKQYKDEKYILCYFLGELSTKRVNAIKKIAEEKKCKIVNILDKNDPYYITGPSEFLWLEKNAELICTDSFHSSVFAILYDKPFVVFSREQKGMNNMESRIDTLLNKFELSNRKFNGNNISVENLEYDYSNAFVILEKEREKSRKFLKKALDIME